MMWHSQGGPFGAVRAMILEEVPPLDEDGPLAWAEPVPGLPGAESFPSTEDIQC